jgi:predicted oxidoreductase
LSEKYNAGADQILLAWLRKHPTGIIPVLGTSKLSRIKSANDSLKINITHEDWYLLWQAATGKEIA